MLIATQQRCVECRSAVVDSVEGSGLTLVLRVNWPVSIRTWPYDAVCTCQTSIGSFDAACCVLFH